MAKKKFRAESKRDKNKKLAVKLLVSLVVFISLYFGIVRSAPTVPITYIYIWTAFVIALAYIFCAVAMAFLKQSDDASGEKKNGALLSSLDRWRRLALIIMIPMIFAVLIDYMLMVMGLADYFGI